MEDPFKHHARGLESPGAVHFAITPDDDNDLPVRPRYLWCNGAGTAVLRDSAGTDLSYMLGVGQILPFAPVRVMATGTTATLFGGY
ncbi:spike base protein, RCAP_Rcc01079 family [Pseudodonghicola flavimaris]|uniref:Uncharacterized protein n=1 Tax=Pseudodonghicola flavimaris TaxID=3050036 RepID=A0ABT7F6A6_9RHOB|nr:hypothetical protein [Pseudodonghicola flavimaris]MDK3020136.1 hypothetical protein [Pseudodonghicola flavimaris]